VRLEELSESDDREQGRVPRTIECELTEGLVDKCIPGDVVTVCGIVHYTEADGPGRIKINCFLLYIKAISVVKHARGSTHLLSEPSNPQDPAAPNGASNNASSMSTPSLTHQDLAHIASFVESLEGFHLPHLVHSFCPGINGHELVKCGLLLALFGGVRKHVDTRGKVPVSGPINCDTFRQMYTLALLLHERVNCEERQSHQVGAYWERAAEERER
jgi:DNA helicase MCM8